VIDEALSVGDGAFGRKSFDRIMRMKDAGKTILFCSHSTYQSEALCSRALWIDGGTVRMAGPAAEVTSAYTAFLNKQNPATAARLDMLPATTAVANPGTGHIVRVKARANGGAEGNEVAVRCGETDVAISVAFVIDARLPVPSVAFGISDASGQTVASAGSHNDGVLLRMNPDGTGQATLVLERLPLLKGMYHITCFLASEDGLHIYDQVLHCITLNVTQQGHEQGLVTLPHRWMT
jgi:lipopolysaccharide transport system ATP-binding protein